MLFSAHHLRYDLEECYSSFYNFLQQRAKFYLRQLSYDSVEVDLVVEHMIEQLTRLGLIGASDDAPEHALEKLNDAQFRAFLNQSIRNKAIDRLRKKRLQVTTVADLEGFGGTDDEKDPLDDTVGTIWGKPPFASPEDAALEAASQEDMRALLKDCIRSLGNAPHQLQAVEQELEDIGVEYLVQFMQQEFGAVLSTVVPEHVSQHKDHAHRKLRQCLQRSSTHLRVLIALRLSLYGQRSGKIGEVTVTKQKLMQDERGKQDISEQEVVLVLKYLVSKGLLNWNGEDIVSFTVAQGKHIARFFEEDWQ